jgi:hypothetical protein
MGSHHCTDMSIVERSQTMGNPLLMLIDTLFCSKDIDLELPDMMDIDTALQQFAAWNENALSASQHDAKVLAELTLPFIYTPVPASIIAQASSTRPPTRRSVAQHLDSSENDQNGQPKSEPWVRLVDVSTKDSLLQHIAYCTLASNPSSQKNQGALKTDTKEAIGSTQKEIDLHFELISDIFQSFSFAGLDQATKLIDPTGLEYDVPVQHYNPNKPFPSIAWSSLESVENFMRAVAEQCCVDVGLLHNLNNNLELDQSTFKKPADVTHVKLFGRNIWHGPRIVNFCAFQPRRQNGTKRSINGNELTLPRIRLFGVHGAQNSLCPTHFNPLQSSQIQRLLIERFQTLANANINSSFCSRIAHLHKALHRLDDAVQVLPTRGYRALAPFLNPSPGKWSPAPPSHRNQFTLGHPLHFFRQQTETRLSTSSKLMMKWLAISSHSTSPSAPFAHATPSTPLLTHIGPGLRSCTGSKSESEVIWLVDL